MKIQLRSSLVILSISAIVSTNANAAYNFIDLGMRDGQSSSATDINNAGQVVGSYQKQETWGKQEYGMLWENGSSKKLYAHPNSINNAGQIAEDGYIQNSKTLALSYVGAQIRKINSSGQMVGVTPDSRTGVPFNWAAEWSSLSAPVQKLSCTAATTCEAVDINDNGIAVGYRLGGIGGSAVKWDGSTEVSLTQLGTTRGPDPSGHANSINNSNQVVGNSLTNNGTLHATKWTGTTPTDLGTLTGVSSNANDINNFGQIVGNYVDSSRHSFAALWSATGATDLNSLLDSQTKNAGWILTDAVAVNDYGWIVGNALDAQGVQHAFLLSNDTTSPVPIPATAWLFGSALFGLARISNKRKKST